MPFAQKAENKKMLQIKKPPTDIGGFGFNEYKSMLVIVIFNNTYNGYRIDALTGVII